MYNINSEDSKCLIQESKIDMLSPDRIQVYFNKNVIFCRWVPSGYHIGNRGSVYSGKVTLFKLEITIRIVRLTTCT